MGNLEAVIGGVLGYGLTYVIAPHAALLYYIAPTVMGVAVGYNYKSAKAGAPSNAH